MTAVQLLGRLEALLQEDQLEEAEALARSHLDLLAALSGKNQSRWFSVGEQLAYRSRTPGQTTSEPGSSPSRKPAK